MNEPNRIGLSKEANDLLDEMLAALNAKAEGSQLIKFDFYRLSVALGVKNHTKAAPIESTDSLRVDELDKDKALYYSVESTGLRKTDEPIYRAVERLADHGIREFYKVFKENMDELDWAKLLS